MKTSISSHYSDFQPSYKYKFFELENAIHTSSKIPVTIWSLNLTSFVQSNQNYSADKIQGFIEKLRMSLNALKRIFHPNILRIYETNDEELEPNVLSFSSERIKFCLDGSCLKKSSETINKFTKDETLFIASQISDGLLYLHNQLSVANFGICPENIFITPNFEVKIGSLIHFSKFSEPLAVVEPNLYPTECSIFDIDKRFLSPELKSHNNVTSKADIFMFGLTILYCYEGENFLNEMESSQTSESQFLLDYLNGSSPSNTPDDMKIILSKCFSEEPSERPTFQQLSDSNALTQLLIKVLNFIDTIEEKPVENHKSFYRGLGGIIDQYSERLLLLKIVPILVNDAYTNYNDQSLLLDHILPMLLTASIKLPANQIDTKIVKKLFQIPTCQNFFLENSHKFLTSANEINDINDRIPFIGAVALNCYHYENTKEKGQYLVRLLFEKSASLDQDDYREIILTPLFKSPDCGILLLFYIQTSEDDEDDSDFHNLAVLTISYALEVVNDDNQEEKSARLEQKVQELIPKLLEYGKSMKLRTFQALILNPISKKSENMNVLLENLNLIDDPDSLALIVNKLKENNNPIYKKIFPILMTKIETMNSKDFEENVFKPFFFTDPLCALSMIENVNKIQKMESDSTQEDPSSQLTMVQSIIINSYKSPEKDIREKVPLSIPLLFDSLTPNQKANSAVLKENIFGPFYENFSSNASKDQEKCILQLIKSTPQDSPAVESIVNLTYENCSSNEGIMNEISPLIPSYLSTSKDIRPEIIKTLIESDKYSESLSESAVSNISSIKDINTKMFILKHALENATESTDYEKLAGVFVEVCNSQEFVKEYNNSKFNEVQTSFVSPLFQNIESADYLISNFDLFDHQFPTSKKVQMLIVTEVSSLVNKLMAAGQDCSALSEAIPEFLRKCSPDIKESLESLQNATDSISPKEPIDYPYISTILDSLNGQMNEELAPKCTKYLRSLYRKIIKDDDEDNKKLMVNKIATNLTNLPAYSSQTTAGVSLSIELVENSYIDASKREQLLKFIEQTVSAIRNNKDFKPSFTNDGTNNDDDDESDNNNDNEKANNAVNFSLRNKDPFDSNPPTSSAETPAQGSANPFDSPPASNTNGIQDPFALSKNDSQPSFNDPFANTNKTNSNPPTNDPFSASSANDPFNAASNSKDPFNTASSIKDPFNTASNSKDPFNAASNSNDPFKTASNDDVSFKAASNDNDPFKTASNDNNPFKTDPNVNDPFNAVSNSNDPFKTASNDNNPFKTASNDNNPFKTAPNSNDPFNTVSSSNDPFKTTPANDKQFNTAPNSNDPFKTTPINNQFNSASQQGSSQESSEKESFPSALSSQSPSNPPQLPSSLATSSNASQNATKSVKIDIKKDKKQKEKEAKEKKKKEKLEKKLKAKDKKFKEKERRKSRNDLPINTMPSGSFRTNDIERPRANNIEKPRRDPIGSLNVRPNAFNTANTTNNVNRNPFATPSNAVDPFKNVESSPNHFSSPNQNNPFVNPFASAQQQQPQQQSHSNDPFGSPSGQVNPFASSQPAQTNNNNETVDPFASSPVAEDNDDSSHDHHHHHHHHHGKNKKSTEDGDEEEDTEDATPKRRESRPNASRRHTENCQSIQPSYSGSQNDDLFKQGNHQRTPSFGIFSRSSTSHIISSSFESENKATSDARIDFNNDEIDFDD